MRTLRVSITLCVSLLCLASAEVLASKTPIDLAERVAKSYQSALRKAPGSKIAAKAVAENLGEPIPLQDDQGVVVAYAWQFPHGGYTVTSADDRIEPIIMQSSTGTFPTNFPNPVTSFIVWDVSARLKAIDAKPDANKAVVKKNQESWLQLSLSTPEVSATATTYGPLITTLWEQADRYNNKCPYLVPYVPGPRRLVGCVATATSQLINFWKYPKTISFSSADTYSNNITFDADASKYGFPDFSTLSSALSNIAYDNSDDEVANLCFAVGLKLQSYYHPYLAGIGSGTSASTAYVDDVLRNHFGFGSADCRYSSTLNWSDYRSVAITNIQHGQPLQIAIHKSSTSDPANHSVLLDGYRDSDQFFHINFGWGSHAATAWYNLPTSYNGYDAIHTIVYNISTYYGWPQYGADPQNRFSTVYGVPSSAPHVRYTRTTRNRIQGFIIGEGNQIYATHNPEIINDVYHPRITAVDQYGKLVHDLEVMQSNLTINNPVQAPNGDVFFGSGDGVYRFRPRSGTITRVYQDAGNTFYGDHPARVDQDGYMYFASDTTLVSLNQNGTQRWRWNCPAGGVMYAGIPSVDAGRENVYIGYWKDSTDEAVLVCINRSTGVTRYSKTFSSIITADRGIHTPAVGSDGTVYASVRTKIYALTPGSSSFSEKWVQDKLYARYQPIALGPDDSVYTEYWTLSGGNYYLTLAKLNPTNGAVVWEKPKPDVGTYSNFRQPIYAGNGVILFPVYWDSSPTAMWQVYAYSSDGTFLWDKSYTAASVFDMAVAAGSTLCIGQTSGTIVGLSDGTVGDPRSGGMGFADNSAPTTPISMSPTNMATIATNIVTLSWSCSDPDGHSLKYDVFFGKATTNDVGGALIPLTNGLTATSLSLTGLSAGVTYLWMVQATDGQALSYSAMQSFAIQDPNADSDSDGMPDWWESMYFGNTTGADSNADADGDGMSNLREYLAGTVPTNSTSCFVVSSAIRLVGGSFIITWQSVPGKTYKVLYADSPAGPWLEDLPSSQVTAGAGETSKSYTDTTAGTVSKRFYRIRVVLP